MKKILMAKIAILCWIIFMGASVIFYRVSSSMTNGEFLIATMVWVGFSLDMLDRIR